MFVLRVTYLTGRVYASVFDDGDEKCKPEWPPHPSRLFSALVSAWGDGGAEEELRPALEWLEGQGAPTIYAGECTARGLAQVFVPVNDSLSLPDERPRKPRTFPSGTVSPAEVYFVWGAAPTADVRSALDRILNRVSSLGHSASLVAVEIADEVPDGGWTIWRPQADMGERIRVPQAGRLNELISRYKRFQRDPVKTNRPSRGSTVLYGSSPLVGTEALRTVFDRMIILRREEGPRCSLRSTLSLLGALRGAVLKLAPQPVPEYLSGHAPESTPEKPVRTELLHVALVPLAFVSAPHATGDLLGVALLLPRTLSPDQRQVCWNVASEINELHMEWGRWKVSLADAEERSQALLPEAWVRPHTLWSTITPFVFDRYSKEPYGEASKQMVRNAFVRIGLPEPCDLDLHYNPWHLGVPRASAFPPAPARPGKPLRFHCHVWARFDRAIAGPVVAGAGRYYGYGFLRPLFSRMGVA